MKNLYQDLLLGRPLDQGLQLQFVTGFNEPATLAKTTAL
jgi:hypothetical protein